MAPGPPPPPVRNHPTLTRTLTPSEACTTITSYLEKCSSQAYLHPDSLLLSTGVAFSAASGSTGGLALHHLRRIEAGLRGERLVAETREELDRLFGDGMGTGEDASGDERLDGLISETAAKNRDEVIGSKRKRKNSQRDEIEQWANETSSLAGGGAPQELESFANTPLHRSDWQDQEEYELQQTVLEGEVGDRDGAPVSKQNGYIPEVKSHDVQGHEVAGKAKSEVEKAARKAAKKQRNKEERMRAAQLAGGQG